MRHVTSILVLQIILLFSLAISSCKVKKDLQVDGSKKVQIDYLIESKNLSSMNIDKLGNIYVVKNNRVLQKYFPDGKIDKTYDAQITGFIHSIDISNPLYILIFYRDAYTIHLLDRNLALLNEIDISRWSTNDLTAAALSNDNRIWLYDNTERKLKKYSTNGKLITESLDLYGITEMNTRVEHMAEFGNSVILRNIENTLIVVDNLGRYQQDRNFQVGLPLQHKKNLLCAAVGEKYSCVRMDESPLQQIVAVSDLRADHLEATMFKFELFQLLPGGIVKTPIIR